MSDQSDNALVASQASLKDRVQVERFVVAPGECVVLCGPNGSGKSSLLRLLAGLEPSVQGQVRVGPLDVNQASRRDVAARIAWLPQRPYLGEVITCEAIVAAARFRFLEPSSRSLEAARAILEEQGIVHLAERPAQQVSGGELQRVLVASLIAQDVPFLLVDEPANHLDPHHQINAYQRLGQLWRDQGRAVVLVTHDVRLAALLGPPERVRLVGVKDGELLPETHLGAPNLRQTLEELYGVGFVAPDLPGGLSVDLAEFSGAL